MKVSVTQRLNPYYLPTGVEQAGLGEQTSVQQAWVEQAFSACMKSSTTLGLSPISANLRN